MMNERKYDLEDRLLEYAASVVRLVEHLPQTMAARHVGGQLLRSGTSPLLNHGEAQAAESPKGFVHKLRVCLKELRESKRSLLLIKKVPLSAAEEIDAAIQETEELIKIFVVSIRTASKRQVREDSEEYEA